jgi:ATP-dependent exoDNAse (exonuclease V) beta subunit
VVFDFFNRFFPKVFGQKESLYGILYEPLAVPVADTRGQYVGKAAENTGKKGRVRVIETSENFAEECFKICSYISFLIREENRCPRDFAVLLRKMTKVEEITAVFEKWGIPYYVVSSSNFYARKEIVSLLSMI